MDSFWKWLTAANARGVFIGMLVGLVCVLGYWIWNEVTYTNPIPAAPPAKINYEVRSKSALLEFLDNNAFTSQFATVENPFLPIIRKKKWIPQPPETKPVEQSVEIKTVSMTPPPPPVQKPKPEVKKVKLVYRGRIGQPPEQVVALIEDQSSQRTRTFKADSLLYGLRIGDIGLKDLALVSEKGVTNLLRLGQVAEIKEQNDGE